MRVSLKNRNLASERTIQLKSVMLYDKNQAVMPPSSLYTLLTSSNTTKGCDNNSTGGPGMGGCLATAGSDPDPQLHVMFPCTRGKAIEALSQADVSHPKANQGEPTAFKLELVNADGSVSGVYTFTQEKEQYTFQTGDLIYHQQPAIMH